jgi:hypothetical protein
MHIAVTPCTRCADANSIPRGFVPAAAMQAEPTEAEIVAAIVAYDSNRREGWDDCADPYAMTEALIAARKVQP